MNPFDLDSDYDLRRAHPSARYWAAALIAGGIAAGLSTTAYAAKQAASGVYPWSGNTGDYIKGLAKSAGIGFGSGAATAGLGTALSAAGSALASSAGSAAGATEGGAAGAATGAAAGGAEGGATGAVTGAVPEIGNFAGMFGGGATGGGGAGGSWAGGASQLASGSVAAEAGAQSGLPTVMTPAVANAAASTPGQAAGGAVPELSAAAANVGEQGGAIVDSAGQQIGTALAPETTPAVTPVSQVGPSALSRIGAALRDVGFEGFKSMGQRTLADVMEGKKPDTRGVLTAGASSLASGAAGGLVNSGLDAAIGDSIPRFERPPPVSTPDPVALQQQGLISTARKDLMQAFSARGAADRLIGGAIKAPGTAASGISGNLVERALAPKPPGVPDPFGVAGTPYGKFRQSPMGGAMGTFGGLGGGLGRFG